MASLTERSGGQAQPYAEDEQAAADLAVYAAQVEDLSNTVVATSSAFIPLEAGGWESGACDLVAQGFLLNPLSTADVAIQNRGGCRSNIEEVRTFYGMLPTMVACLILGLVFSSSFVLFIMLLNPSSSSVLSLISRVTSVSTMLTLYFHSQTPCSTSS
jgi:hypothetical protein